MELKLYESVAVEDIKEILAGIRDSQERLAIYESLRQCADQIIAQLRNSIGNDYY